MNEYANHRGVKAPSVRYAVSSGKINPKSVKREDGGRIMINASTADKEWNPKVDARHKTDWGKIIDEAPERDPETAPGVVPYAESKAKREAAEASLAELKLEKERGRLLDAEEVKKSAFNAARMVRNGMLNIPDRVAAELAAETDVFKISQRLREEIRKALEGLGKDNNGDD